MLGLNDEATPTRGAKQLDRLASLRLELAQGRLGELIVEAREKAFERRPLLVEERGTRLGRCVQGRMLPRSGLVMQWEDVRDRPPVMECVASRRRDRSE